VTGPDPVTDPEGFTPIPLGPDGVPPDRLDLVFLGAGAFGVPTLRALIQHHNVRAVVTQPDRPAGRGRALTPTDIAAVSAEQLPGLPLFKAEDINAPGVMDQIRAIPSHAWVVIAFGQKLSDELIAGKNAMNLHGSRLPRWRGAAPIHHAIMSGDAVTGNSVITIADRMDAGQILGLSERAIEPGQTTGELHDLLSTDGPELVLSVLDQLRSATLSGIVQNESLVTRATKLGAVDRPVRWDRPAHLVARQINGLSPWPGATSRLDGATLKLVRAVPEPIAEESETDQQVMNTSTIEAGTILDWNTGLVAAGDAPRHEAVRLLDVQPPGKPVMPWPAYARGRNAPKQARFVFQSHVPGSGSP
jgi:methionyl-tRNA formyltransferase